MEDTSGWYGLVVNGELTHIKYFKRTPLIWDFDTGYFNSSWDYEVVAVNPIVTKIYEIVR